ncbi:MAG: adenylate/guanylate cyclase domain-containing protein [Pirellulales bacterium]
MADLIAQGTAPADRWRRPLPLDETVQLGREAADLTTAWDDQISRVHAKLCYQRGRLVVHKHPDARNAIFFRGSEQETFTLNPGQYFVIGRTTFTLMDDRVTVSVDAREPMARRTFSVKHLQDLQFRNVRARLEVLSRLPDVISGAASDTELLVRLTNMLLAGIPAANAVALVHVADGAAGPVQILHWDRHLHHGKGFQPSEKLIREAIHRGESVLHVWSGEGETQFTVRDDVDWSFCTPVEGEACRGWAIYVAGSFSSSGDAPTPATDAADLGDDVKFTEIVASTLRSLRELRGLQRRHAGLSQFFSPVVLGTLASEDPDVALAPRETDVCVLFCDLRGFARASERSADDLLGLLHRVSSALGVTTHHILQEGGVVGDFQGDAAMGFWGWPLAPDRPVEQACRAALAIRGELELAALSKDNPLSGFKLGIGIATGRAVAGKIGTVDQVKVTVFGPVVNLASRLEGMTKLLQAPILVDEPTADTIRQSVSRDVARCRRLAVVCPAGLDTSLTVSELLPPETTFPLLSDQHLAEYEAALDAFQAGEWPEAFRLLHRVPAEDRAKDFLTGYIARHNRTPPADWDGVIRLTAK